MRNLISTIVGRQAAGMAITGGLLLTTAALGFIALGCLAFALYFHLRPTAGAAVAACITAAVFLIAALIVALIARRRLVGGSAPEPATTSSGAGSGQADLAVIITHLLREELPKNAVPATLVALVGGIAAGLNPQAARTVTRDLLDTLMRKPD